MVTFSGCFREATHPFLAPHLEHYEVPEAVYLEEEGGPLHEDCHSTEEHAEAEEVAQVHALGHPAGGKDEDGVGEEVDTVDDPQQGRHVRLGLAVELEGRGERVRAREGQEERDHPNIKVNTTLDY